MIKNYITELNKIQNNNQKGGEVADQIKKAEKRCKQLCKSEEMVLSERNPVITGEFLKDFGYNLTNSTAEQIGIQLHSDDIQLFVNFLYILCNSYLQFAEFAKQPHTHQYRTDQYAIYKGEKKRLLSKIEENRNHLVNILTNLIDPTGATPVIFDPYFTDYNKIFKLALSFDELKKQH